MFSLIREIMSKKEGKIAFLVLFTGVIALFHYAVPTDRHTLHMVHIALRKLYFLPPVMAAVWFGFRGSVYATLMVSAIFSLHAFLDWPGNYMEQANQAGELVSFWAVGLVSGWLFDRERALLRNLARANEETLLALVSALDLRERHTRLHSQRVKEYTLLLANHFGLDGGEKRNIGFGALLHDVGKIAIPDAVLLKPERLTKDEWNIMRIHPIAGYGIVKRVGFLREAAEIVRDHHEHFDGSGYPTGLKGEEIPLGARIFAVADAYDALTSERPYRTPWAHDEVVAHFRGKSGVDFDPKVVQVFLTVDPEVFAAIRGQYPDDIEKQVDAVEKE